MRVLWFVYIDLYRNCNAGLKEEAALPNRRGDGLRGTNYYLDWPYCCALGGCWWLAKCPQMAKPLSVINIYIRSCVCLAGL